MNVHFNLAQEKTEQDGFSRERMATPMAAEFWASLRKKGRKKLLFLTESTSKSK